MAMKYENGKPMLGHHTSETREERINPEKNINVLILRGLRTPAMDNLVAL